MNAKALLTQFAFNYGILLRNVEGVTAAESLYSPASGGNCLNWVVGHITTTRNSLAKMLGEPPFWNADSATRYTRGSSPVGVDESVESWEKVLAYFEESQGVIVKAVGALDAARLAEAPPKDRNPFKSESMAELLAAFTFHESYHVGQTGLLRRLLGKPGAVK